jgi:hypothetical protein
MNQYKTFECYLCDREITYPTFMFGKPLCEKCFNNCEKLNNEAKQ